MHAILVSVGTDGDLYPYLGLGKILRERGHKVTLAAAEQYRKQADSHGFIFEQLVTAEENEELFHNPDFWKVFKTAQLCAQWGLKLLPRQYQLLSRLVTQDAVIISNPGVFASLMIHEKFSVPLATLVLQPGTIPSVDSPPLMPGFTFLNGAPKWIWKCFWNGLDLVGRLLVGREINRFRSSLGLRPMRRIFREWLSPQLVIATFPHWFANRPTDWPTALKQTSFPLYSGITQNLPDHIAEFCRSGEGPVAFTFGTGMAHPGEMFKCAMQACNALKLRAIFLTKFSKQLPTLSPNILHCEFAPFRELFPLCSAVVHHGGIGTVAEGLAAGVPQLVRPICFDQFDNGERLRILGAGDWLRISNPTTQDVVSGLKAVLAEPTRVRAQQIANQINRGKGLEESADLIEELARVSRRTALPPV